ncbi:MAG: hypothetical protein WC756_08670 [Taibaiella sp.]|jgi:hypothetical protein
MKFGIVDKIFYNEYLSEHLCSSCKQNFSTKLICYCKTFATGFAWWAWNKQGYIECTSCGAVSDIKSTQVHAKGIRSAFSLKSLPLYYFLPSILMGTIVALLLLGITIGVVSKATTTGHDRFEGVWASEADKAALFVFADNTYTFINSDTIVFGKYKFDKKNDHIGLMIQGQRNDLQRLEDGKGIQLHVAQYEYVSFSKVTSRLRGNSPYRKEYNQWRMKARHPESPAEIKARVMGYLNYLKQRYQWALQNELSYLPYELYSPILMAQNGIAIDNSSKQSWRPIFYSEENWQTANTFLSKTFPRDRKYNEKESNVFIRNLECITFYIENAEKASIE